MRRTSPAIFALLSAALLGSLPLVVAHPQVLADRSVLRDHARPSAASRPARFEANRGQADPSVAYLARSPGMRLSLTHTEAVLHLASKGETGAAELRIRPVGGAVPRTPEATERLAGVANYLRGNDPSQWVRNVPTSGGVRYRDVWPGIDWAFHGRGTGLEYDVVVAPGADPSLARLAISGQRGLSLDPTGDLVMTTDAGQLRQHRPEVYQDVNGQRRPVSGAFVVDGETVGFRVGSYDHGLPLVIDPVLTYSSFFGGTGLDVIRAATVDGSGFLYVAGSTESADFPMSTGGLQSGPRGSGDAFVAKLSPTGDLVYATYLGGTGVDWAQAIAVDSAGAAYVAGGTKSSTDFPTTSGVFQASSGGGDSDGIVAKLSPSGSSLVYSTYLGGNDADEAFAIAVDGAGEAHVAGRTRGMFPTLNGLTPVQNGSDDTFVTKFDAQGRNLSYSTLLGGLDRDVGRGIAVDPSGAVYVAGWTQSENFPTTLNAFQATRPHPCPYPPLFQSGQCVPAAFVTKIDPTKSGLSALTYSTLIMGGNLGLPGSTGTRGYAIAIDAAGAAYIGGGTDEVDLPTTANAAQRSRAGTGSASDAMVAVLNPAGTSLTYCTYLGGGADEVGGDASLGLAVDHDHNVYVAGTTASTDFPTTAGALPRPAQSDYSDAFVTILATAGPSTSSLRYSTYLGGVGDDEARALALGPAGNIWVAGDTRSPNDFPVRGFHARPFAGDSDGFISNLSVATRPVADFDGNGATDVSVFRPSTGTWFATTGLGLGWGAGGDTPIPADFDGDGTTDIAIFRPATGLWAIHNSGGVDTFVTYGVGSDVPVPADYDGDGKADIAVFRPSVGTWYVHRSSDDTDVATTFGGLEGDVAVPADYDGDGRVDLAIYRRGAWFVHPASGSPDVATGFGTAADMPVPADYDGDSKTDVAIFRPATGLWAIHTSGGGDRFVTYGIGTDTPVPADYDGDGRADLAIFRPSTGAWFAHRSSDDTDSVVTFGISGDVPLPLPYAIRKAFSL